MHLGMSLNTSLRAETRLVQRIVQKLEMKLELRLEQRLDPPSHSPLQTPGLTIDAQNVRLEAGTLDKLVGQKWGQQMKMVQAEAYLLNRWKHASQFRDYLDAPLLAHADAAAQLSTDFDATVSITNGGKPYGEIFEIMGVPGTTIDYSHHKRHMDSPTILQDQINWLRTRKNILLVDIDCVTGKTIRTVLDTLRASGLRVGGAYLGLTRWPGIPSDVPTLGAETTNFDTFWTSGRSGLSIAKSRQPYKEGILPEGLIIYAPNPAVGLKQDYGSPAAQRIAKHLRGY